MELATRAALTAGRGGRWAAVNQCHGLLGNVEALVDAYEATGDSQFLREARPMVDLIDAYSMEVNGMLVWPYSTSSNYTPDLLVGFSGVAPCLLRLIDPGRRPHLLSRLGLTLTSRRGA
jgi:lantibiotic modifying enzyme